MKELFSNPIVTLSIGVAVTIITTLLLMKRKKPCYYIKSNNIFRDFKTKYGDFLKITYSGREVNTITRTKIAFWNAGRDPLRRDDIASKDQIAIKIKNGKEFLHKPQFLYSDPGNDFSARLVHKKYIEIDFEYLAKNDGCVIQLFHTGTTNEDLSLTGTAIGPRIVNKGRFVKISIPFVGTYYLLDTFTMFFSVFTFMPILPFALFLAVMLLGASLNISFIVSFIGYLEKTPSEGLLGLIVILLFLSGLVPTGLLLFRFGLPSVPKKLRNFL